MKKVSVITKKIIALQLLLLIVVIMALPITYLPFKHFIFELQQETLGTLNSQSLELTTLTFSLKEYQKLPIEGEKEFVYKGNKYDIYETKHYNDSVNVKALKDTKETDLDNLHKEINNSTTAHKKTAKAFAFYFYEPIDQAAILKQPSLKHNQHIVILYNNPFSFSIVKPPRLV